MKLYLSRRRSGRYILSALPPVHAAVAEEGAQSDLYFRPGEPIGVDDLCPGGILKLFEIHLARLETVRVELRGHVADGTPVLKLVKEEPKDVRLLLESEREPRDGAA